MLEMVELQAIDALWKQTLNEERWGRELIRVVKSHENCGELLKAHFDHVNPSGDDWVLYNWFTGTCFGIGINAFRAVSITPKPR